MKSNTKRNDEIFALNSLDPIKYSGAFLGRKYKISRATVNEIIMREKAKRGDKEALKSGIVRRKYPGLLKKV